MVWREGEVAQTHGSIAPKGHLGAFSRALPWSAPAGTVVPCSTYPSYPSTHHGSYGQQGSSPFHPPRGAAGLCHQLCSPLQFQQISKLLRDQESKPCCTDQHNKIGLIPALEKQNRLLDDCTQEDFFLSARSVPLLGILLPKFCL